MTADPGQDHGELPKRLGRYELVRPLGSGGTGRVLEAILHGPRGFRKRAALKVLHGAPSDGASVARLVREARYGALLSHPNVVSTLELGEVDGTWFVAMELVRGPSLAELLAGGPLGAAAVIDVGLQVCAALGHLHGLVEDGVALRLVHRDVKPSNLLIDSVGLVRLGDFGIAAFAAEVAGRMSGSPGYMAPEQMAGHGEPRSDLFGLGMTLLTAVTGRNPLGRGIPALHATREIEERLARRSLLGPADRVLPGLGDVLRGCLRADPADRWPDAAAVGRALRALRAGAEGTPLARLVGARAGEAPGPEEQAVTLPVTTFGMLLAPPEPLVGRSAELAAVLAAIGAEGRRLVTLTGPPGVGKTRLAIEVAARARPRRETLFCELAAARTAADLARAVAVALGVEPAQPDVVAGVGGALAGRGPALLILDNLEQLGPAAAEVAHRWLAAAPEITLLATSRAPLRTAPEEVVELAPLDPGSAAALFAERRGRPVDAAEREAVDELLRRVDHLPLAIELVAARGRAVPAGALLERLGGGFALRAGDPRSADPRHRTVRAAIAWSWDLLGAAEQLALAQLSVFEGRFTLEAAEAVLDLGAAPDGTRRWALDVLGSLVDQSLLQVSGQQFGMLALVRAFARERLAGLGGTEAAERRHGEHHASYGSEAARIALRRPGGAARLRALCELLPDLVAAAARAVARRDPEVAVPTTLAAIEAILLRGPTGEGIALADRVLALPLSPLHRGLVLEYAGELAAVIGDGRGALARLDEALGLYEAIGDRGMVARARARIGKVRRTLGEPEVAREALELALAEARSAGHRGPEATALCELSLLALEQGRAADGLALGQRALEVSRAAGDARGEGAGLVNVGLARRDLGDTSGARRALVAALEALRDVGDLRASAVVLANLGLIEMTERRLSEAHAHTLRALEIQRRVGARRSEALLRTNLAVIARELRAPDEARRWCEEAIALCEAIGDPRTRAVALSNLAQLDLDQGRLASAGPRIEAALAGSRATGNRFTEAVALLRRGRLAERTGDLEGAVRDHQAAAELAARHGFEGAEGEAWLGLARLARVAGDPGAAAAHLARAEARARTPDERAAVRIEAGLQRPGEAARCLAQAEAALGGIPCPLDLAPSLEALRARVGQG